MYGSAAAATLRLRTTSGPAGFVAPFGPLIPIAAILVTIGIGLGATREQLIGGAAALASGAVLFAIAKAAG